MPAFVPPIILLLSACFAYSMLDHEVNRLEAVAPSEPLLFWFICLRGVMLALALFAAAMTVVSMMQGAA